jgi:mannan endo-1,4-beta-mannosidase
MVSRVSLLTGAICWGSVLLGWGPYCPATEGIDTFIVRRGDQLWENDKLFRFISFNIPNLQLVEDNFAPGAKTAWRWPNRFELNDALASVRQLGGTVVRTYVLSVRREGSDMGDHVYVRGPGQFNEEAFQTLDMAIEVARQHGVRLIIPLVDGWKWQGGRAEYAAFRNKPPDAFWTDEQVIADFEQTIKHVLTRVNSRTGVAYRDDSTILAWETGNELDCPASWTRRIAAYIKSLDGKHLVLDGGSWRRIQPESLEDPNIDLLATHHYPNLDNGSYVPGILAAREATRGKKPYFVGEFGFAPLQEFERVYDTVVDNDISGALLWSLRFHNRDGGFYWHWEPAGGGLYKAYHWPGFDSGREYEEREVLALTRAYAFKIRGLEATPLQRPDAPKLLPIRDVAAISWQGSVGARDYTVERSSTSNGPWRQVGEAVDDASAPYRPLFHDRAAEPGESYHYRVLADNGAGVSAPSRAVGPVRVEGRTLVDVCQDLSLTVDTGGDVRPTKGDDRRRREDLDRLSIAPGGSVTYEVDKPIKNWEATLFADSSSAPIDVAYSADGVSFTPAAVDRQDIGAGNVDYGYLHQIVLRSGAVPPRARFLKLGTPGLSSGESPTLELSHVEIRYDAID